MACQTMHMWSLSGLMVAFLDLAIAYLLLCASTVAFLASKILGFFGFKLPCPCDGLFLNIPSKIYCLNWLLVDFPTQIVANVQISVKQKFPFNGFKWAGNHPNYNICENNYVNGIAEMEGEASCSSVSDARRSWNVVRRAEKYDLKGKGVMNHRPRSQLCRHRKGAGDHQKYSVVPHSHYDIIKGGNGVIGNSSLAVDNAFDVHHFECDKKAPAISGMGRKALNSVQMSNFSDEDIHLTENLLSAEELQDTAQKVQIFNGEVKHAIGLLERELEEEHNASAALYSELEKERSAAAAAADEAMAMILRLQEEKAFIEMEARQHQRIIEEKSSYDAEEINILKEILVRREREKHFLEQEVEVYRQMVSLGNEGLAGDGSDGDDARQQLLGL